MSSIFGTLYRLSTFGESHGHGVGAVIDGCPSNILLDLNKIQLQLNRRRPNQSKITTSRNEVDLLYCYSGLENNITLGSPIMIMVKNNDHKPKEYSHLRNVYRPSHADYSYHKKYKILSSSGSGRASARETIARIIGGNIAKQVLDQLINNFCVYAYTSRIGDIKYTKPLDLVLTKKQIDGNIVRCPDNNIAQKMQDLIEKTQNNGDSLGGEIACEILEVPIGLGEPLFDKLNAQLAKSMLSIPASRYFAMGDSVEKYHLTGEENNDRLQIDRVSKKISYSSNHSGGITAGISNGNTIKFKVGFKPPSTIAKLQSTVTHNLQTTSIKANQGRHDPCVVPRAVAIVEAMATMVILDNYLMYSAYENIHQQLTKKLKR